MTQPTFYFPKTKETLEEKEIITIKVQSSLSKKLLESTDAKDHCFYEHSFL